MGRYTRKGKVSGEVLAVMDPPLGVRTRAKTRTLALQKPSSDYLELRNRRLEKPAVLSPKAVSPKTGLRKTDGEKGGKREEEEEEFEVSFIGENLLDADVVERSTRESTPCNLIMNSDAKCCTPGSTTRPATNKYATNRNRARNPLLQTMPTPVEIEEFFSVAEQLQQRNFMEKYNFDPVNESPLPGGRYEWEKLDC